MPVSPRGRDGRRVPRRQSSRVSSSADVRTLAGLPESDSEVPPLPVPHPGAAELQRYVLAREAIPVEGGASHLSIELSEEYRRDLEASIQDEMSDVNFYARIANEAPNEILRLLALGITGDEYGHARIQAALLSQEPPAPSPPEPSPATGNFREDVEAAVRGEISAMSRYADLAARAPDPDVRYLLTSILTDEYAHSRIWTAMLLATE